jgi:hypothetical protein
MVLPFFLLTIPLRSMTNQHPITPSLELVQQWTGEQDWPTFKHVTTQAARWGWDQRNATVLTELQQARDEELGACCEWVEREIGHGREWGTELRTARRPKALSLKEQALDILGYPINFWTEGDIGTIRRALEALPE